MRVVVVREYIDKYTGVFHPVGEKLTVNKERFAEIQKAGTYLVDISDEVKQAQGQPETNVEEVIELPVEQTEPEEVEKTEKTPSRGGRRNRVKKESEDK